MSLLLPLYMRGNFISLGVICSDMYTHQHVCNYNVENSFHNQNLKQLQGYFNWRICDGLVLPDAEMYLFGLQKNVIEDWAPIPNF